MSEQIELRWLGQAGYEITLGDGSVCWIDPYLSDLVEEELGIRRIVEAPLDPSSAHVDIVAITHWHPDHLDTPTCLAIAEASPDAIFVCPPSCVARLAGRGVSQDRFREPTGG